MQLLTRYLLLLFVISLNMLPAQNSRVQAFLGLNERLTGKATGFAAGVEFSRRVAPVHYWALEMQYNFAHGRGILPELPSDKYILRDYVNPTPRPFFGFFWDKNSFPGLHLSSRPDKYFTFSLAAKYLADVWKRGKHRLSLGAGVLASFHDEMVLIEFIRGDYKPTLPIGVIEDGYFPVFRYDTYLDAGLLGQFEYQFQLRPRLSVSARNQCQWMPASNIWALSATVGLGFIMGQ